MVIAPQTHPQQRVLHQVPPRLACRVQAHQTPRRAVLPHQRWPRAQCQGALQVVRCLQQHRHAPRQSHLVDPPQPVAHIHRIVISEVPPQSLSQQHRPQAVIEPQKLRAQPGQGLVQRLACHHDCLDLLCPRRTQGLGQIPPRRRHHHPTAAGMGQAQQSARQRISAVEHRLAQVRGLRAQGPTCQCLPGQQRVLRGQVGTVQRLTGQSGCLLGLRQHRLHPGQRRQGLGFRLGFCPRTERPADQQECQPHPNQALNGEAHVADGLTQTLNRCAAAVKRVFWSGHSSWPDTTKWSPPCSARH